MTTPTSAELLRYADLQMAAEAILRDKVSGALISSGTGLISALKTGNDRTSVFTEIQAIEFEKHWVVLDQEANTSTGFSGTLLKNKQTGELVMSFRSTEFIDDAARDNQATNTLEVKEFGWAFGQIADMENWYQSLKSSGKIAPGDHFSVTGYSLGGHLATAFALMRDQDQRLEGIANPISSTYTFNGAGVGVIDNTQSLKNLIADFDRHRKNLSGHENDFSDPDAQWVYGQIRALYGAGGAQSSVTMRADAALIEQMRTRLNPSDAPIGIYLPTDRNAQLGTLQLALERMASIQAEVERLPAISSGDGAASPNQVSGADKIDALRLDYQLAVLNAEKQTDGYRTDPASLAADALSGRRNEKRPSLDNFYDIFGSNYSGSKDYSSVANSQWHYGVATPIFIEDQPLLRGNAVSGVVEASIKANSELKLLVPNFGSNNFGDTHSLVLLVDSLSVQNTLLKLDTSVSGATLGNILRSAANDKADWSTGTQGKADGNTLESVINSLVDILGLRDKLGIVRLKGDPDGGTWALTSYEGRPNPNGYTTRADLHKNLDILAKDEGYQALLGKTTLTLADASLATKAKTDFGAFMSVYALSPFVLQTTDSAAASILKQANATLAESWEADYNARLDGNTGKVFDFSDQWYADRAAMLVALSYRNKQNLASENATPSKVINGDFTDLSTDQTLQVRSGSEATTIYAPKIIFGSDHADPSLDGNEGYDRLYGGGGADILNGKGGNDYLEGGRGIDTYLFDGQFGKDTILDSDGQGQIKIKDQSLGEIKGNGSRTWKSTLADDTVVSLQLLDDARSSTGKKLVISLEGDSSNTITIQNFDLTRAQNTDGQGYLGIKLPKTDVVVRETGSLSAGGAEGKSFWSSLTAKLSDLAGKVSNLFSGSKSFTVDLNQPAKAGDTITLHLALDDSALAKAILGDRKVDANGAVITLEEGQTSVSFALVTEGDVTADISGGLSVTYASEGGQTATSNTWGLNVKDAGETAKTFIGDQRALLWGVDLQPDPVVNEDGSVTQDIIAPGDPRYNTYAWSKTEWAADGTLTGGVAEAGFNDVIYGSSENDKIQGQGGNDALDGRGGNDYIDGGDGADLIAGGAGSDHILGGAGNDVILSATTMVTPERRKPDDPTDPVRIVGNVIVNGGPLAMDSAADVIEAGDGDDEVYAGHGDDRIDGGNGTDVLYGLGGDDVIEGGAGNDKLLGDGVTTPATYGSAAEVLHGSDFLDGGDGNDALIGGGKGDVLYGGGGDDDLYGDTSADPLAGQYHGDDYLDGEDGTDRLWGNGASDTLYGGAGNDKLYGDAKASELEGQFHGNDYLDGEDGDDELVGFGKDDVLYGGAGNDLLYGDAAAFELAGQFHGNDSLDGEDGDDTLVGGGRADILYGGAGNDQLQGDGRADDLGGEFHGDDYLDGEDGDDILIGDGGADILYGGSGNDYLMGDNAAEPGAPNHLSGAFHGDDYLDGGEGNDTLVGDGGTDTLLGGAGNDILLGDNTPDWLAEQYHGNDFVDGGEGDDTLYGGGGDDVLLGGAGNDVLAGEAGADYMDGGAGDDTYLAGAGDTVVDDSNSINTLTLVDGEPLGVTASGADLLLDYGPNGVLTLVGALTGSIRKINGVSMRDWISTKLSTEVSLTTTSQNQALLGGMGNDVLTADHAGASLYGAAGDDMLIGGGNFVRMDGGDGNDVLQAGDGGSEMHGGIGGDAIYGGAGNDILDGGAGDDVLTGGDGVDTYLMYYGMGRDKVVDASSEGALIQLASGIPVGNLKLLRSTDNLVLRLGGGNDLEIENYFNGNASNWTIRLDDGAQLSLETLVAAMPVIDPENEASTVLQEEAAFLDAVQSKLRQNYLSVIPGYSTPYQMQPDGSLVSQTNIHINEYWGYAVIYRQVESRYFSSGLTTRNTSSTTEKYLLQTDSFPYFYDKTVVKFESSVISSNDAYIVADETQVSWADTRSAWVKVSWNAENYSAVQRSSISSTDPFPIIEYGATVGQRVIYQWVDNFYARTSGVTTGVVSFANGSPGTDFRSFGYREGTRVEKIQTVNAGDADNVIAANSHTVVNGGAGNDVIQNAGYAYGGDGDDVLVGGGTLRGGSGNDYLVGGEKMEGGLGDDILIGGRTMVASAGHDEIYAGAGYTKIEIDPEVVTSGLLGGAGDSTYFLDQYYQSIGIAHWQMHSSEPGIYHLKHSDIGNFWGTREELEAIGDLNSWTSFEEGLAEGWIYAPLPPAPLIAANDFRGLEPYYEQGVLQHHVVAFGAGVSAQNLQFSWGELDAAASGEPSAPKSAHVVLNISWNGDQQNIQVIIPHSDDPIGSGISQFTFADGTVLGMADILELAPTPPSFDPQALFDFVAGSGETNLTSEVKLLRFDLSSSELVVKKDGSDLLLTLVGSTDSVRLLDWCANPGAYFALDIEFDGEPIQEFPEYLQGAGIVIDGSAGDQTWTGVAGYPNTFITGPNSILIGGTGGQNTYVFNAGSGVVHIQDSTGNGVIQFGAGITPDQVKLVAGGLTLRINDSGDEIHIDNFNLEDVENSRGIAVYRFVDGTTWSVFDLLAHEIEIYDTPGDDILVGTAMRDRILSVAGQDILVGGKGDDTLIAGADANVFEFQAGDGRDVIDESAKAGTLVGADLIKFGSGVATSDLFFGRAGNDVLISNLQSKDALTVRNIQAIDRIVFHDGSHIEFREMGPGSANITTYDADGLVLSSVTQTYDGSGNFTNVNSDGSGGGGTPDGSYYVHADDGDGGMVTTNFDRNGNFVSAVSAWAWPDGSHGTSTRYADGSSAAVAYYIDPYDADGYFSGSTSYTYGNDGHGLENWIEYDANGLLLGSVSRLTQNDPYAYITTAFDATGRKIEVYWGNPEANGNDLFHADGTSSGVSYFNNGSGHSAYFNDGAGTITTQNFDAAGDLLGKVVATDDGQGNASIINFDANDVKLSGSWIKSDGSYGSTTFNPDGSGYGTANYLDGSFEEIAYGAWFGYSRNYAYHYDANWNYLGRWEQYDYGNGETRKWSYDANDVITRSIWTFSDGSYSEDVYAADGSFITTEGDGKGLVKVTGYDADEVPISVSWTHTDDSYGSGALDADGILRGTGHYPDGRHSTFVQESSGTVTTDFFDASGAFLNRQTEYPWGYTRTEYFDDGGNVIEEHWRNSDGSYGTKTFMLDGSSSGTTYYPDGRYETYTDDGQGSTTGHEYSADGIELSFWWEAPDGSYGYDSFHADGSSSGESHLDDGTRSTYVSDGQGNTTTHFFDADSNLLNYVVVNDDGNGNVHTSTFDAAGNLISDSWEHANAAPEATLIAAEVAQQGVAYAFHIPEGSFVDPDTGDILSYSAKLADGVALPAWLTFDAQTQTFRGTPQNADVGVVSVAVTATDLAGESATSIFEINVANTNDAPVTLLTLAPQAAVEQQPFVCTLPTGIFADIDAGDSLSYTLTQADGSALPAWLTFNATDMTVSGTPTGEAVGGLELLLIATDTAGATATQALHIGVQALSVVSGTIGNNTLNAQATGSILMGLDGNDTLNGNVGGDKLYGGIGADRLYGQSGNDVLDGGEGNDRLEGGAGADQMLGGLGNDTYVVDDAGDLVTELADEGTDVVQSLVDYTLTANVENLTLTGTAAINGTGNELNNVITGNAAGNTLRGLAGNDTLRGGLEVDSLEGGEGNDRLDGGAGADQLAGGLGNDVYLVDEAGDVVTELADEGTDTVQSLVDYTLSDNVENLTLTGIAAISGTGNELNNVITGNAAGNLLRGLGGNDTLRGGLEADVLEGGEGNDRLDGGAGADQLAGGAGNDVYVVDEAGDAVTELADEGADTVQSLVDYTLGANLENLTLTGTAATSGTGNELNNVITGNAAGNLLRGLGGNDTLRGGLEADVLEGGEGNDRLDGGAGADQLAGGLGNDVYVVDEAGDAVTELADEGTDTVQSLVDYTLGANLENLTLTGTVATSGTGNELNNVITGNVAGNTLHGLGGNDTLRGGLEADTLEGGVGNDRLEGGAGADTYLFARGEGQDVLVETDATVGVEDVLQFGHDITAEQIWLRQVGNSLEISLIGSSDKVAVANWYLGTDRHVEALQLSDGRQLLDSQVQSLVQAMAAFTPPPVGQTTLPESYAATLTPVIAANWQ